MKPDREAQQMPKRSIRDDQAKAMIGGVKPKPMPKKPSDTARKQTAKLPKPDRQLPKVPPEVGLLQAT